VRVIKADIKNITCRGIKIRVLANSSYKNKDKAEDKKIMSLNS
jgi:hypothetical protein